MRLLKEKRELDAFETVRNVFWAKYVWQAKNAVSNSQVDYDLLIKWFSENIPVQYDNLEDIWRAYDALSKASIFLNRAKTSGWDLLSYTFDLMGPGVAMAETEKFKQGWKPKWKKYQFPQVIQMLYKSKENRDIKDSILEKIGRRIHASSDKTLNDVFPYFIQYAKLKEISKNLELTPKEQEYLSTITGETNNEETETKYTKKYPQKKTYRRYGSSKRT